jgi:hypothetical protein
MNYRPRIRDNELQLNKLSVWKFRFMLNTSSSLYELDQQN